MLNDQQKQILINKLCYLKGFTSPGITLSLEDERGEQRVEEYVNKINKLVVEAIEFIKQESQERKFKYSIQTINSSEAYPLPIKDAVQEIIKDRRKEGWELIDKNFATNTHTNGTLPDYVKETYTLKFKKEIITNDN